MKRTLLTAFAALLAAAAFPAGMQAQTPADSLARVLQAENFRALTATAASVTVVATKKVPRAEFPLWLGHLTDGSWAPDGNWYPRETERLYLSRAGRDSSLDIVFSVPLDTCWSTPEPICAEAVSRGNEIYPMLSPDGKRLWFASDSLFGMGGYDLYEASWDPVKKRWGQVRNLGVPYNSKGDDLFFCDTPDGRYSVLVSNRDCDAASVTIYVLRQEVTVQRPVSPAEAEKLLHLAVTAPDNGYPFVKQSFGKVPDIPFVISPEEEAEKAAAAAAKSKTKSKAKDTGKDKKGKKGKKESSVKIITEEYKIVK